MAAAWREKRANDGEDAIPYVAFDNHACGTVLGVCDGLGGAGARRTQSGETEARVAARHARRALTHTASSALGRIAQVPGDDLFESYASRLQSDFDGLGQLTSSEGGVAIQGTLAKRYPTTVCSLFVRDASDNRLEVQAVWAGDSRSYVFTPGHGLQQLTLDHTRYPDPHRQLETEGPLSSVVQAAGPISLEREAFLLPSPSIVLALTDGFFSFHREPGELELRLLLALSTARSFGAALKMLLADADAHCIDDASLAAVAVPKLDDKFRAAVRRRASQLGVRPSFMSLDTIPSPDRVRAELPKALHWDQYAVTHMAPVLSRPAMASRLRGRRVQTRQRMDRSS